MRVFLTIDTELWPAVRGWPVNPLPKPRTNLASELAAYVYGRTRTGDYGIEYQMQVLERHGLRAVFFVEPLFSAVSGMEPLARIVSSIEARGHEVGLHPHTEWLGEIEVPGVARRHRPTLSECSREEQAAILAYGKQMLLAAGAREIRSFRAGSYSANTATLDVLAQVGIPFDSSLNPCYGGSMPDLPAPRMRVQPESLGGTWEFPVSFFADYPGHFRHAQLCACSFRELRALLQGAAEAGWFAVVIVLHSSELIKRSVRADGKLAVAPDRVNIRRFEGLCRFLGENRDRFQTVTFRDLDPASLAAARPAAPVRSHLWNTALRFGEQLVGRFA